MYEIKSEGTEKIENIEKSESVLFSNLERIKEDDGFKSDISKEKADDIYDSIMREYTECVRKDEGPDSDAFRSYYEDVKGEYPQESREEVYEKLSGEYEFLEDWLHRSDDEWGMNLYEYNETRCVEDYGDSSLE